MTTLRVRSFFLAACIALAILAPGPGAAQEGSTLEDEEGDASTDALDIVAGSMDDDGVQFALDLLMKDLSGPVPDVAAGQAKVGWRMIVDAANSSDPAKTRAVFVQAQVIVDPDAPAPQPPGTASGPGTSFTWGIVDAEGAFVLQGKLDGASLDREGDRVSFALPFDRFRAAAAGAERVDLAGDGVVSGIRAQTLSSPHPYYGALGDAAPAWEVDDEVQPTAYTLSRLREAAPMPTMPTNTTMPNLTTSAPTALADATTNATLNETATPLDESAAADSPGAGPVAGLAAMGVLAALLRRRPPRPLRRD